MCVDDLWYVNDCESYVLDECDEPLLVCVPCMCVWGCSGVFFLYFIFLCEFCFLYCDDVWLGALDDFFTSSILFLMPFMFI